MTSSALATGRRLAAAAAAVATLATAAVLGVGTAASAGPAEGDLVAMTNSARAAAGAAPLAANEDLARTARAWSEQMARSGRLSHNPATGSQVCCWQAVAENVGYSYRGAADVHRMLMDSAGHRTNILNRSYTQVGIGTATDAQGRIWVTEVFRRPTSTAAVVAPPAPVGPIGAIAERWRAIGASAGPVGAPTTNELATPDGVGRFTHFQRGSIYWTPPTGAHEVYGAIHGRWSGLGWERSPVGYPTTGELPTPDGVGRFNHFQWGSVYWTPSTGAHEVYGAIRHHWASQGWEKGPLGYPTSGEYDVPGGRANDFQRGKLTWDRATGRTTVHLR